MGTFSQIFSYLLILLSIVQIASSDNHRECVKNGRTYKSGDLTYDECNSCVCRNGYLSCTRMACRKGVCYDNGKSYEDGDNLYADCNTCRCMAGNPNEVGNIMCTLIGCPGGFCYHNGQQYNNGDTRKDDDGCNTCNCEATDRNRVGKFACTEKLCLPPIPPSRETTVALITGLLKFPPSLRSIPAGSCLGMYVQKAIQCMTCFNPKLAETIITDINLSTENVYRYTLKFPSSENNGIFSVQATLNMGWCKSGDSSWIRQGDYMSQYSNEFTVQTQQKRIAGPNIKMELYGKPNVRPAPIAKPSPIKQTVLNSPVESDDCGGLPITSCSLEPCAQLYCKDNEKAECRNNYCGGCKAEFYLNGRKIQCENRGCRKGCPYNYEPYCGSDGKTYSNLCLLQTAQCEDNRISIAYKGLCIEKGCSIDGEKYSAGETFISKDCSGQCKCSPGGGISCVSLCPPSYIRCGPGFKEEMTKVRVGNSQCSCDRPRCVKDKQKPALIQPSANIGGQNFRSVEVVGYLTPKPSIRHTIPTGSCINVAIRRSQYPDVLSRKQIKSMRYMRNRDGKIRYTIKLPNARPGEYEVEATLNIGWCKTGTDKNSEWVRDGDYHTQTAQILKIRSGLTARMVRHDVEIEKISLDQNNMNQEKSTEKSGIITGNVILKDFNQVSLKYGSCLHVYAQEEIYCYYCENPYLSEYVDLNPQINNNKIPYKLTFDSSKIKSGRYIITAILNNGWCLNDQEWIRYNDFHNEYSHTVQLPLNGRAQKDVVIERYQSRKALSPVESSSVVISGDVILPYGAPVAFSKDSCLDMTVQKDIQGDGNPILANIKIKNPQVDYRRIPFKFVMKKPNAGDFIIQATLNNGWCHTEDGPWIRNGDYFNDYAITFSLSNGQLSKELDVNIAEYRQRLSAAPKSPAYNMDDSQVIPIYGNVRLPNYADVILKRDSCMHIQIQENIYCEFCYNNILHNETIQVVNGLPSRSLPYEMNIPRLKPGSYVMTITLNNGRCRNIGESVQFGDYFNDEIHQFEIVPGTQKIQKDIKLVEYVRRRSVGPPAYKSIQKN